MIFKKNVKNYEYLDFFENEKQIILFKMKKLRENYTTAVEKVESNLKDFINVQIKIFLSSLINVNSSKELQQMKLSF